MIYTILVIVQVVVALALVALILLQHGKGADAGAAFGSGASGTVFGAKGSANFMSRATAGLATLFMLSSLTLAYLVNGGGGAGLGGGAGSVTDQLTSGDSGSEPPAAETRAGNGGSTAGGAQNSGSAGAANGSVKSGPSKPSNTQNKTDNKNDGPKIPD